MRILLLQNHESSGPGYLEEPAARRGARFEACMPHLNADHRLPEDDSGYDGFLLMGGAMHAGHVEEHPWLEDAAALVRRFTEAEKPVLGVCLGSQIVARAFGGRCYDMAVPEVGFVPVRLTVAAETDPLLGQSFDNPVHLAEFHSQTFDLPEGATRLMVGDAVPNQAFRIGAATYSFQPHFEVTPEMMTYWVSISDEVVPKYAPTLPEALPHQLQLHHHASHDFCYRVGDAWLDLVATQARRNGEGG